MDVTPHRVSHTGLGAGRCRIVRQRGLLPSPVAWPTAKICAASAFSPWQAAVIPAEHIAGISYVQHRDFQESNLPNFASPALSDLGEAGPQRVCVEENGGLFWPFPLPSSYSASGNLFLMLSFGYILLSAAGLISKGSELLLEILNPGIVGGLLLPVLGALPDALLIYASGTHGTVQEAQLEVSVGLGALAGSTTLLLTIAWAASLVAGSCDIQENGRAKDRTLTKKWDFFSTGVTTDSQTRLGARIMMLSCLPYLAVQIPLIDGHPSEGPEAAVIGAAMCGVGFVLYAVYQVSSPWLQKKRMKEARKRLVQARVLRSVCQKALTFGGLLGPNREVNTDAVDSLFRKFDSDSSGTLDVRELRSFLLGAELEVKGAMAISQQEIDVLMQEFDTGKSGSVSMDEFRNGMTSWTTRLRKERQLSANIDIMAFAQSEEQAAQLTFLSFLAEEPSDNGGEDDDLDNSEEEEDELSSSAIARTAAAMLALGAGLVATFADPAVTAIGNFSDAVGVDTFLVAFVVTPLASNASEVISAFLFARKKRKTNISLCYSQVYGAVTMNNTLCLGLFLTIVHARGLAWDFSAESTAMVSVILLIGLLGSSRSTFRLGWAIPVALLYPLSLAGVAYMEKVLGWN